MDLPGGVGCHTPNVLSFVGESLFHSVELYIGSVQWCRPKIVRRRAVHEEILDHTLYECSFS